MTTLCDAWWVYVLFYFGGLITFFAVLASFFVLGCYVSCKQKFQRSRLK